ncbi:MAG: NAD(P)H-dependent oxidoreductase [Gammaproteobacteria bacterium]|nr:NAD(P)H-dependent oxidoreductase [Gammaproteobacteria bacterium]
MPTTRPMHILRIDSSARHVGSVSRDLGDEVVRRLREREPGATVERLDLADGIAHIDGDWIAANFTPGEERDTAARDRLATSDAWVASLQAADAVVVTAPIYNFSVPSTLRAWIDHVCRAGLTFRYSEDGPQGLLDDRPVYLAMASGGVPFGSDVDFASDYLRQVFRFIGIDDVRLVGAAGVARDAAAATQSALAALDAWLPASRGRAA